MIFLYKPEGLLIRWVSSLCHELNRSGWRGTDDHFTLQVAVSTRSLQVQYVQVARVW